MAEQERKWEHLARLRTVQLLMQPHSNPPSASVPPESPVIPSSAAGGATSAPWGALPPPPPPRQAAQASDFVHAVDPEFNLGDFIYIDDEPPESAHASVTYDVPTAASELAVGQGSTPITGILTFAPSQMDMLPCASFNLNALWSTPLLPLLPPQPKEGGEGGGVSGEENEGGDAMDLGTPPDWAMVNGDL
jgi:hypothetical protein